jgi:hypothetical protein
MIRISTTFHLRFRNLAKIRNNIAFKQRRRWRSTPISKIIRQSNTYNIKKNQLKHTNLADKGCIHNASITVVNLNSHIQTLQQQSKQIPIAAAITKVPIKSQ